MKQKTIPVLTAGMVNCMRKISLLTERGSAQGRVRFARVTAKPGCKKIEKRLFVCKNCRKGRGSLLAHRYGNIILSLITGGQP